MDSPEDRRKSHRYPARRDQVQLGWWEGEEFRVAPALIRDISTGGAKLDVDTPPLSSRSVWVGMPGGQPTAWVRAGMIGPTTGEDGARCVRVEFPEQCTYEFFKAAVWGTAPLLPVRHPPPPPGGDERNPARPGDVAEKPEPGPHPDPHGRRQPAAPVGGAGTATRGPCSFADRRAPRPPVRPSRLEKTTGDGPEPAPFLVHLTLVESERTVRASKGRTAVFLHATSFVLWLSAIGGLWFAATQEIAGGRAIKVLIDSLSH